MTDILRVGLVGAGSNTRAKHVPGLRAQEGVEIVSVANRTAESSRRAAEALGIPNACDDWLELVEADDVDAVCIGTWPYMHCPVTLAALENDKHVLCEARMAMDAAEAHAMLEASRDRPHLVTQVVPAPGTLKVDDFIAEKLAEGYLGDLLAVELRATQPSFLDPDPPLHWRQDTDLSGFNTLSLGIQYESLMRWIGPATRVTAMAKVFMPRRKDASGLLRAVTVPDHLDVIAEMACGALANMRFSAVTGLATGNGITLYGSEGTLRWDASSGKLFGGRRGDDDLVEIPVPEDKLGGWRVEEEFVNAIRGKERVRRTRFEDGVRYMEFTEAVIRSAQTGEAVALPL